MSIDENVHLNVYLKSLFTKMYHSGSFPNFKAKFDQTLDLHCMFIDCFLKNGDEIETKAGSGQTIDMYPGCPYLPQTYFS